MKKVVMWAIGLPIGLLVFMFILGTIVKDDQPSTRSEKDKFNFAASECWKKYELKSNTPSEKVSIAKFCEGLEQRAKDSR